MRKTINSNATHLPGNSQAGYPPRPRPDANAEKWPPWGLAQCVIGGLELRVCDSAAAARICQLIQRTIDFLPIQLSQAPTLSGNWSYKTATHEFPLTVGAEFDWNKVECILDELTDTSHRMAGV